MRRDLTPKQLMDAMHESRCRGDLASAMKWPALAISLRNTAEAMQKPKPQPKPAARIIDFKRASAGDLD
jgi:hypothetical protein